VETVRLKNLFGTPTMPERLKTAQSPLNIISNSLPFINFNCILVLNLLSFNVLYIIVDSPTSSWARKESIHFNNLSYTVFSLTCLLGKREMNFRISNRSLEIIY
jgi:hypothetical protein